MKKKDLEKEIKRLIQCNNANKVLRDHYKDLFDTSVDELKFTRMSIDGLIAVISEIEQLSEDTLIDAVIENWLNRYRLDKLIHARLLFNEEEYE